MHACMCIHACMYVCLCMYACMNVCMLEPRFVKKRKQKRIIFTLHVVITIVIFAIFYFLHVVKSDSTVTVMMTFIT